MPISSFMDVGCRGEAQRVTGKGGYICTSRVTRWMCDWELWLTMLHSIAQGGRSVVSGVGSCRLGRIRRIERRGSRGAGFVTCSTFGASPTCNGSCVCRWPSYESLYANLYCTVFRTCARSGPGLINDGPTWAPRNTSVSSFCTAREGQKRKWYLASNSNTVVTTINQ